MRGYRIDVVDGGGRSVLVPRATRAGNVLTRMRGLLGVTELAPDAGLWITACSSIHMFGMSIPIDAAFVDREGTITRLCPNLKPWSLPVGSRRARAVVELPVGTIARAGLRPGLRLELVQTD